MATWKKIVTESGSNEIAQNTTGNAATATELSSAITINLTSEVTGTLSDDLTAGETFDIQTTVANDVLDVANFTDAAVVTGTEVAADATAFAATSASPSGDTMLATTSAVIEYINAQGFGTGGGDIEKVQFTGGAGIIVGGAGGNTSIVGDTATAESGDFVITANIDLATLSGLELSSNELKAKPDGATIEINATGELAALTGAVDDGIGTLTTGDQVYDWVTSQNYITSSTFTVSPAGGIIVSEGINTPGTGDADIATGQTLNISIDSLPNDSLTGDGTTHLGITQLTLGDASGTNLALEGLTSITGSTSSGMQVTNLSDLDFYTNGSYTIFDTVTSGTITMGGSNSVIKIAGDLIVEGETTTVNTGTVQVEDKLITLAKSTSDGVNSGTDAFATGGGIELDTTGTIDSVGNAKFTWTQLQGAGSIADGTGASTGLTGWKVRNSLDSNHADHCVAIMDFQATNVNPGTGTNSAGIGSFMFDTAGDDLYIRVS